MGQVAEQHEDAHRSSTISKPDRKPSSPNRSPRRQLRNKNVRIGSHTQGHNKPKCFNCGKVGHVARNCFKKLDHANAMMSEPDGFQLEFRSNEETTEVAQAMSNRPHGPRQSQTFSNWQQVQPRAQGQPPFGANEGNFPRSSQNVTSRQEGHQIQRQLMCKIHKRVSCLECNDALQGSQHSCGAMIEPEAKLSCGCVVPLINEACSLGRTHAVNMPVAEGKLFDSTVQVLRDTGCSTVVVRRSLVPDDCLTGDTVLCGLIDGTLRQNPVARIVVNTPYLKGVVKVTCMINPMYDLIVGDVPQAEEFSWSCKGHSLDEASATEVTAKPLDMSLENNNELLEEVHAVVTKSHSKKDDKVKPLKVTQSIDSQLDPNELSRLQREDATLNSWFEKAESQVTDPNEKEIKFEVRQGLLRRIREDQKRQVKQLAVPLGLRDKVMSLSHDCIMSGHQGAADGHASSASPV